MEYILNYLNPNNNPQMESDNRPNKIFELPSSKKSQKDTIIGLIDSSGSMSSWFKMLAEHWNKYVPKENTTTICFSNRTYRVPGNVLSTYIGQYGGGGTNILGAFQELEKQIMVTDIKTHITVLFISDG